MATLNVIAKLRRSVFRLRRKQVIALVLLLLLLMPSASYSQSAFQDGTGSFSALPQSGVGLSILRNSPEAATVHDICCGRLRDEFQPISAQGFSTVQFAGPVWLAVDPRGKTGVLTFSTVVDEAVLYRRDPLTGSITTSRAGDSVAFSERDIPTPQIGFPIELKHLQKELFIKVVQPTRVYVGVEIKNAAVFESEIEATNWVRALLLGGIVIMILYNCVLAILVREITFLFNALCIASLLLVDIYLTGFGAAYVWPEHPALSNIIMNAAFCTSVIFGSLFVYSFLRDNENVGAEQIVFFGLPLLAAASLALQVFVPYAYVQRLLLINITATLIWIFGYTIWRAYHADHRARILLVPAITAMVPGLTLVILQKVFGQAVGRFDAHVLEAVLVVEALMFSLALAYRIRIAEQEKINANFELQAIHQTTASRIVKAIDTERRRVAADLHDTAGQGLLAISSRLSRIGRGTANGNLDQSEIEAVADYSREVVSDIRRISHDLHPAVIDHLGWKKAIEQLFDRLSREHDMFVDLEFHIEDELLDPDQQLQVYRIAQELISNIAKHSEATTCEAQFWREASQVKIAVLDNGIGLPQQATAHSLGLRLIDQRVNILTGSWSINSTREGTNVQLNFPVSRAVNELDLSDGKRL